MHTQADEFERLADADEELAARIRGAPQITVCAAPIACGKADGQLCTTASRGSPRARRSPAGPRRSCAASCPVRESHFTTAPATIAAEMSARNLHAGDEVRFELSRGQGRRHARRAAPRGRLLRRAPRRARGRAGYCDPAAVEAARDDDVDRQLGAILERGRRSTRQKKRR